MIGDLLKSIFGDKTVKDRKEYWPFVEKANAAWQYIQELSDDQLREKTSAFQLQVKQSIASLEEELGDVYAPYEFEEFTPSSEMENIRVIDAISNGLRQSMERHENLVIMGQDIAEYGGAFKITDGFVAQFGKERVRNTPICESAVVSAANGLSINGFKAVMEMQFADFVSTGFNPIVNLLAKQHYRWLEKSDVVVRMPCGGGTQAGPFHSQTNEAWFTKTPGLKVVYPAFPYDAKGLLKAAIRDNDPIIFMESEQMYGDKGEVPEGEYIIPIGVADVKREGTDVTLVSLDFEVRGLAISFLVVTFLVSAFFSSLLSSLSLSDSSLVLSFSSFFYVLSLLKHYLLIDR